MRSNRPSFRESRAERGSRELWEWWDPKVLRERGDRREKRDYRVPRAHPERRDYPETPVRKDLRVYPDRRGLKDLRDLLEHPDSRERGVYSALRSVLCLSRVKQYLSRVSVKLEIDVIIFVLRE
jgi:hypothetical protein